MTTLVSPGSRAPVREEGFFAPLVTWLTTTDHKRIGVMYMVTGTLTFVLSGVFALLMRLQLAMPDQRLLDPETYNQLMSAHGAAMLLFFVTVFVTGIANYMVPIMIGARDMAFPRLNLLGFWMIPASAIIYFTGFAAGGAMNAGWTGYPPLSEKPYNPSVGVDCYALSVILWALSGIMASVNFLTTIVALRVPGMTLRRLPVFVWAQISTSILLLMIGGPLAVAMILLELDRQMGTHFFTTVAGRPVLYQHLFWFFGHPEVYVIVLPGFGMISEIIPVFSRKPIFGYTSMVTALFAIVFLSMAVWAHHMFTVGMNIYLESFFMGMTMLIAIPTGIKFFNWIATAWRGSVEFRLPMKFAFAFLATFVIGGITGVYLASVPVDTQLHNSYYVVAHFHYTLFGGGVFAILAGVYYWFPKITGRMMNDRLGEWNFWTLFIGVNATFLPMFTLGLDGMPRRIVSYDVASWGPVNLLITVSSFVVALSILLFIVNVLWSWKHGEPAGDDPWQGNTLEWATTSPPPPYNFERVSPVRSFMPLRELRTARAGAGGADLGPSRS
ncbi:MAG TPA: cytochrome c oxidase subunit I [Candidatus Dormibacteraeota bacterium]|nr:cytochrome c oxidase subunit I [Candidatus Dormibacteraeota bacterium]